MLNHVVQNGCYWTTEFNCPEVCTIKTHGSESRGQEESRLTVVSREAKKKQHARASSGLRDHYSELFTWMAALKF